MNTAGKSKALEVALWAFSVLMALTFLVAGDPKLLGAQGHVEASLSGGTPTGSAWSWERWK